MKTFKTGMVFGVFDGLHEGHKHFLSEATEMSEELIVVVTLQEIVASMKGREPKENFEERVTRIAAFDTRLKIVPGDAILGEWKVIAEHKPDMVFLGHDQQAIARELEKIHVPFSFVEKY